MRFLGFRAQQTIHTEAQLDFGGARGAGWRRTDYGSRGTGFFGGQLMIDIHWFGTLCQRWIHFTLAVHVSAEVLGHTLFHAGGTLV